MELKYQYDGKESEAKKVMLIAIIIFICSILIYIGYKLVKLEGNLKFSFDIIGVPIAILIIEVLAISLYFNFIVSYVRNFLIKKMSRTGVKNAYIVDTGFNEKIINYRRDIKYYDYYIIVEYNSFKYTVPYVKSNTAYQFLKFYLCRGERIPVEVLVWKDFMYADLKSIEPKYLNIDIKLLTKEEKSSLNRIMTSDPAILELNEQQRRKIEKFMQF